MRDPVIASLGQVEAELPANRAKFDAAFSVVRDSVDEAIAAAAAKVSAIDATLRSLGAQRVQFTTTFVTRPLYEQYRDKSGAMIDNSRADKVERYEASAVVIVAVQDIAVLEETYNAVVAARPTRIGGIEWRLDPDNAAVTKFAIAAARDAAERAQASASAVGARLGAVKVIDPSGGVCETEVLAGWPAYSRGDGATRLAREGYGAASASVVGLPGGSRSEVAAVAPSISLTPRL